MAVHKTHDVPGVVELITLFLVMRAQANRGRKFAHQDQPGRITYGRKRFAGDARLLGVSRSAVENITGIKSLLQVVKADVRDGGGPEKILDGRQGAIEIVRRAGKEPIVVGRTTVSEIRQNFIFVGKINMIVSSGGAKGITMVFGVHKHRQVDLAHIVDTESLLGQSSAAMQSGQEQARNDGYNGNGDEKFNERKSMPRAGRGTNISM
jgi:hypothetical protein